VLKNLEAEEVGKKNTRCLGMNGCNPESPSSMPPEPTDPNYLHLSWAEDNDFWAIHDLITVGMASPLIEHPSALSDEAATGAWTLAGLLPRIHPLKKCREALAKVAQDYPHDEAWPGRLEALKDDNKEYLAQLTATTLSCLPGKDGNGFKETGDDWYRNETLGSFGPFPFEKLVGLMQDYENEPRGIWWQGTSGPDEHFEEYKAANAAAITNRENIWKAVDTNVSSMPGFSYRPVTYDYRMAKLEDGVRATQGNCRTSNWPRTCSYWNSMHMMAYLADHQGIGKELLGALAPIQAGGATMCVG
jgi:hypothetical protein